MRKMSLCVSAIAILLALAAGSGAVVRTIYYDYFDGPSGVDLQGTMPDITTNSATWQAGAWVNADGTYGGGNSNQMFTAALPFTPTIGAVYELSATVNNSGDWVGIAFLSAAPNVATRLNDNSPYLWSLTRPSGSAAKDQAFIGPGASNAPNMNATSTTSSAAELKVRIEMNGSTDWLVTWYFDGSQQWQRTINPTGTPAITINYVAFGSNGLFSACTGTISSFKLVEIPQALKPNPSNGSLVYSTTVPLQWQPGIYAARHDVYIGTSFTDVNNANTSTPGIYIGRQDPNSYTAAGLTPGITYYWRIDEVRADGTTIDKGEVWSFRIQPLTAYNPSPVDGAKYMDSNIDLAWSAGAKAKFHDVYLGTNLNDVSNAKSTDPMGPTNVYRSRQSGITYDLETLALGMDYYWRIDEVNGVNIWPGDVWRFSTIPVIPVTDPNLMGWWKFDEGQGIIALDWSGRGNNGTLVNGPQWSALGQIDGALQFDGLDDTVSLPIGSVIGSLTNSTFAIWVNWARIGATVQRIFDFGTGTDIYMFLSPGNGGGGGAMQFNITTTGAAGQSQLTAMTGLAAGWHHIAVAIDGVSMTMQLYDNGELIDSSATQTLPANLGNTTQNFLGRSQAGDYTWFIGFLDDLRIYNEALTQGEIGRVMEGDPLLAWNPSPANGSTPDILRATPLTWSPGDRAVQHDVYFGDDPNAVADANTSTAGIYQVRQSYTSYTPLEDLNWGMTYYWRIDEINTDGQTDEINLANGAVSRGRVWRFTVADYIVVDDMESYGDVNIPGPPPPPGSKIWYSWMDGYGWNNPSPGNGGNGTCSMADLATTPVNGGFQSLRFDYYNNGSFMNVFNVRSLYCYSEVNRTFYPTQDWTGRDVRALTLWFYGAATNSVEPLYVALQDSLGNTALVNYPDPVALLEASWHEWNIDLQQFAGAGVNLSSIRTMYIGVGSRSNFTQPGGTGTLYFDDIRLYRSWCRPSLVRMDADLNGDCVVDYNDIKILGEQWLDSVIITTPVAPSITNLVGWWTFDDGSGTTAADSSSRGNNGLLLGDLRWVPGIDGGALWFSGTDDYVELQIGSLISTLTNSTFAVWVNFANTADSWQRIFDFGMDDTIYMFLSPRTGTSGPIRFSITTTGGDNEIRVDSPAALPNGWQHLAVTINANSDIITLYLDGVAVAQNTQATLSPIDLGVTTNNWLGRSQYAADDYYAGRLDDFRIYNRALSAGEVAWLAGRTGPFSGEVAWLADRTGTFSVPYDLNMDGRINFEDFAELAQDFLEELLWP